MTTGRNVEWRWLAAAAAVAFVAGAAGRTVGAAPQVPQRSDDVLPALLAEVRGLRVALEQMASAGPRIQLSVARLQLEEGRITSLTRRLQDVRDTLSAAQREYRQILTRRREMESALTSNPADPDRSAIETAIAQARTEADERQRRIGQLTAEDAELAQQIAAEQAQWTMVSQRLDELERELARK